MANRKTNLHPKIRKYLETRSLPIEYSSLSVDSQGDIVERKLNGKNLLDQRIVEGYGVIWGNINSHLERFIQGCFAKSIKENGPNSNANYQIKFRDEHGRACSLFEELKEDEIGLYFRTKPLDAVPWCDHLLTQLRSKTINNFSLGFRPDYEKVSWDDEDECIDIREGRCFEISATAIPSDMETYAKRSREKEYVNDDVEDFILTLPRSKQLEARRLFSECMTLTTEEPIKIIENHSRERSRPNEKKKPSINYRAISKQIKI